MSINSVTPALWSSEQGGYEVSTGNTKAYIISLGAYENAPLILKSTVTNGIGDVNSFVDIAAFETELAYFSSLEDMVTYADTQYDGSLPIKAYYSNVRIYYFENGVAIPATDINGFVLAQFMNYAPANVPHVGGSPQLVYTPEAISDGIVTGWNNGSPGTGGGVTYPFYAGGPGAPDPINGCNDTFNAGAYTIDGLDNWQPYESVLDLCNAKNGDNANIIYNFMLFYNENTDTNWLDPEYTIPCPVGYYFFCDGGVVYYVQVGEGGPTIAFAELPC